MTIPRFIPVSTFQVITSFKQVLHGAVVLFRVDAEGWREGLVFSESRETGVVGLGRQTSGRFWHADHILWPLLDVAGLAEVGFEPQLCPGEPVAAPELDGAVYARSEDEAGLFRGLYIATWQDIAGERALFRMMTFKDPFGAPDEAGHWSRWGFPRLTWRSEQFRSA